MYKVIQDTTNISYMNDTLKSDGVFVVPNYLSESKVSSLYSEMMGRLDTSNRIYEFGKAYRGDTRDVFGINTSLKETFDVKWMRDLTKMYKPSAVYGHSLFSTYDYISTSNWERQAWLHFDKQNSLKFFIYLTDVEDGCGALNVTPKTHKLGKKLRTSWSDSHYETHRKLETTLDSELSKYNITPIHESKGSLIVFDTDTFHKGGVVEDGKSRLVVRLHCK